jgi:diacylglycerol kinase family enzyme
MFRSRLHLTLEMATLPKPPSPLPMPLRAAAILNVRSGRGRQHEIADRLSAIFAERRQQLHIGFARRSRDIFSLAKNAVADGHNLVLAGGGDGTIAGVASVIARTDSVLGILPLGTFNLLARELGIPADPESAARLCFEGAVQDLPMATVNGRPFLNNASLGLYPAMLRLREEAYHRWGRARLLAYLTAMPAVLRRRRHLQIELVTGGEVARIHTPLLFAARSSEQIAQFGVAGMDCIKSGSIGFYILPPLSRLGLLSTGIRLVLRRLNIGRHMQFVCARELRVLTRRPYVNVAYDGEIERMRSPLSFSVQPHALRVLVPRAGSETSL